MCYVGSMHNGYQLLVKHYIYELGWANVGSAMRALGALGRRCASVATKTGANMPHLVHEPGRVIGTTKRYKMPFMPSYSTCRNNHYLI